MVRGPALRRIRVRREKSVVTSPNNNCDKQEKAKEKGREGRCRKGDSR